MIGPLTHGIAAQSRRRTGSALTTALLIILTTVTTAFLVLLILHLSGWLRVEPQELEIFQQTGSFRTAAGQSGEVKFPIPYATAPNVELPNSGFNVTIIVESSPTGFKWKNSADLKERSWNDASITWTAKGIRATSVPK